MVDKPQELIATLKDQHRTLQADLTAALAGTTSKSEDGVASIFSNLLKFKKYLLEHLKLENDVFYPDYLDKKAKRGEDAKDTKEFIKQMDDIGKVVMAFLEKYNTPETIAAASSTFSNELQGLIDALNARIETEEEGVFGLYLLF